MDGPRCCSGVIGNDPSESNGRKIASCLDHRFNSLSARFVADWDLEVSSMEHPLIALFGRYFGVIDADFAIFFLVLFYLRLALFFIFERFLN